MSVYPIFDIDSHISPDFRYLFPNSNQLYFQTVSSETVSKLAARKRESSYFYFRSNALVATAKILSF